MWISVVIPLYNKEGSILSTVDSVLSQTHPDFELVIVNDGSTDKSMDVLKAIDDKRVTIIDQANGGVSSARNKGISQARYDYVAFLDGDDLWEPGFLSEINNLIRDFPDAGIWGTSYSYLRDGEKTRAEKPLPDGFYGILDNRKWEYAHVYCSTAVCCSKKALHDVGCFDERIAIGEDLDTWWRIMLNYPAAFSNRPLAVYRMDEDNRAMNRKCPLEKLHINYLDKYQTYRENDEEFRHFIDKECMWWLFQHYSDNPHDADYRRILSMIDFSEYKFSFRFRFAFPRLFKTIKTIQHAVLNSHSRI